MRKHNFISIWQLRIPSSERLSGLLRIKLTVTQRVETNSAHWLRSPKPLYQEPGDLHSGSLIHLQCDRFPCKLPKWRPPHLKTRWSSLWPQRDTTFRRIRCKSTLLSVWNISVWLMSVFFLLKNYNIWLLEIFLEFERTFRNINSFLQQTAKLKFPGKPQILSPFFCPNIPASLFQEDKEHRRGDCS